MRRARVKRQGNFWQAGMPLTAEDHELLASLLQKAQEQGYTPIVSEVPEAARIKKRFRCWKDALLAAGLLSEKYKEQVEKRMAARRKADADTSAGKIAQYDSL